MNNEELELALKDVNGKLAGFDTEEKPTNQQWRQQQLLKKEKSLLESIIKSRENGFKSQEAKYRVEYMILKDERKLNPFLKYLMQLKFRSQIWW